jgi:hypothetical protein
MKKDIIKILTMFFVGYVVGICVLFFIANHDYNGLTINYPIYLYIGFGIVGGLFSFGFADLIKWYCHD